MGIGYLCWSLLYRSWQCKVAQDACLDKERERRPSWSSVTWIFPSALTSPLSPSCSSPSSSQPTKVGLPSEKERKKRWCVYSRGKLFEPGGFRPKIDSLSGCKAGNYWPGGKSGKQHTHYTWRLLAHRWTPEWQCKWVAAPFLCGQKSRGSLEFCWARLMFLSCMRESSCLWGGGSGLREGVSGPGVCFKGWAQSFMSFSCEVMRIDANACFTCCRFTLAMNLVCGKKKTIFICLHCCVILHLLKKINRKEKCKNISKYLNLLQCTKLKMHLSIDVLCVLWNLCPTLSGIQMYVMYVL